MIMRRLVSDGVCALSEDGQIELIQHRPIGQSQMGADLSDLHSQWATLWGLVVLYGMFAVFAERRRQSGLAKQAETLSAVRVPS
jgi:hypothetical protein